MFQQFKEKITAASCAHEIDKSVRDAYRAHRASTANLTEEEVGELHAYAIIRRSALQPTRRSRRNGEQVRRSSRPRWRGGPCPRTPASLVRRRELYAGNYVDDSTRRDLTIGNAAVASVIAQEHIKHGVCTLPNEKIGALSGTSRRWVQVTLRLLELLGLIKIEYREIRPGNNDTNLITIICPRWLSWLARRPKSTWWEIWRARRRRKAAERAGGRRILHATLISSRSEEDNGIARSRDNIDSGPPAVAEELGSALSRLADGVLGLPGSSGANSGPQFELPLPPGIGRSTA